MDSEARMKAALEAIARNQADKLERGYGVSRAEYIAVTAGLRQEAERVHNSPISTASQANANGKKRATLLQQADERDKELASGLLDYSFMALDESRRRNGELAEYRKMQALADIMRQEQEAVEGVFEKWAGKARNLGVVGLTHEEKLAAVRQFHADGSNIVRNDHGRHFYFTGGMGNLPIRATISSDGNLMFAPGENVSGALSDGGE